VSRPEFIPALRGDMAAPSEAYQVALRRAGTLPAQPKPRQSRLVYRPTRNGLPVVPRYQYQARTYPWAQAALAAAEAEHGAPRAERANPRRVPVPAPPRPAPPPPAEKPRCNWCGYLTTRCCCPEGPS
jgi:hypothetical protein